MKIGNREFDTAHGCYVMGILNVTPDSFSDGGKWNTPDAALFHVENMVKEGAAIIDVGGESTRPGYEEITEAEEIERILPVIEAIRKRFDLPISVDTYKSRVAEMAISAGADLVNDIWGLKHDPQMAEVIAKNHVACCLMHNRMNPHYDDFEKDWLADLAESVKIAKTAGIAEDKIILDPGVGFAKDEEQNLYVIRNLDRMRTLGYPILLGASRKSVIGTALHLPKEDRLEGTLATSVLGVERGASFIRVHDVKENYRAIQMAQAVLRGKNEL